MARGRLRSFNSVLLFSGFRVLKTFNVPEKIKFDLRIKIIIFNNLWIIQIKKEKNDLSAQQQHDAFTQWAILEQICAISGWLNVMFWSDEPVELIKKDPEITNIFCTFFWIQNVPLHTMI